MPTPPCAASRPTSWPAIPTATTWMCWSRHTCGRTAIRSMTPACPPCRRSGRLPLRLPPAVCESRRSSSQWCPPPPGLTTISCDASPPTRCPTRATSGDRSRRSRPAAPSPTIGTWPAAGSRRPSRGQIRASFSRPTAAHWRSSCSPRRLRSPLRRSSPSSTGDILTGRAGTGWCRTLSCRMAIPEGTAGADRGRQPGAGRDRSGRSDTEHSSMRGMPFTAVLRWAQALACVTVLCASSLFAQYGYFGQNKIQYRRFDWRVLRGEHVDLYYYPEEEELGRVALAYAEASYDTLERRFNHAVTRRIPLIVYASHSDFEQTNILPFIPPEGLLGVTEFLKRRVALPFRGSYAEFRHTIRHELVHVFQLSLTTEVFNRYPRMRQAGLPLWWTEGLAEYFSAGEDSRDEMVLRDMTVTGQLPSLRDLTYAYGGLVYPVGGSLHRYLAEH